MTKKLKKSPKYYDVKAEVQTRHDQLFTDCGVFWAFSNEQFDKGRPADKSVKLVSIGMGGYMPKDNFDRLIAGTKDIKKWEAEALKAVKAEEAILYELNNHEAFYAGDIAGALEVLEPMGYTAEQVREVYHANRPFAIN